MGGSFAVIGAGFRAAVYWRLAARLDGLSCVGVVARTPRRLPVPVFDSPAAVRPDFFVTATPRAVTPSMIEAAGDIPVLVETPPAADLEGLRRVWPAAGRVQVAEQYLRMPTHAARLAAVRAGLIGEPTQVQVSSTQLHHAVSLIRGYLGAGRHPVTVRAVRHHSRLVDPLTRAGWTDDPRPRPVTTTIATLDLGHGRSGLYDFTDNQTRNQLRFRRILVRGTHGELRDDEIIRLTGPRTIVRTPIIRHGDHVTLGDRLLFPLPYAGKRWNDDEQATAAVLESMAAWVRGAGPPPYPLADGSHDQQVALAIDESADTDRPITTTTEPWTETDL